MLSRTLLTTGLGLSALVSLAGCPETHLLSVAQPVDERPAAKAAPDPVQPLRTWPWGSADPRASLLGDGSCAPAYPVGWQPFLAVLNWESHLCHFEKDLGRRIPTFTVGTAHDPPVTQETFSTPFARGSSDRTGAVVEPPLPLDARIALYGTEATVALLASANPPANTNGWGGSSVPLDPVRIDFWDVETGAWLTATSMERVLLAHAVPGHRYAMVARNTSYTRIELLVAVDGLDVVTGRPVAPGIRGLVIPPRSILRVGGLRVGPDRWSPFRFSGDLDGQGGPKVGLWGFAIFFERGQDPHKRPSQESNDVVERNEPLQIATDAPAQVAAPLP
jgi:hypothetical protein